MHTIYGGLTLNGIRVESMVDNSNDMVTFKEDTEFFVRITQIGDTSTQEPLKPGVALFYNAHGMEFTPLIALEAKEDTEDFQPLIDECFACGDLIGIYQYSPAELQEWVELATKLEHIEFKGCNATDSDGHTTESTVEYEGEEYYVYSSAYTPLSFAAECARDILETQKKEAERNIWYDIYMTFDDYNYRHADCAYISNGYNIASAKELHQANLRFLQEVAEQLNDHAPYPKIRAVSEKFSPYLDELKQEEASSSNAANILDSNPFTEKNLEISKMLSLCTAHLTEKTAGMLDTDRIYLQVVVYNKPDAGWFVHVPDDFLSQIKVDGHTCPQDLYDCLLFAHNHGCNWIMFDRDVEPVDALQHYEW